MALAADFASLSFSYNAFCTHLGCCSAHSWNSSLSLISAKSGCSLNNSTSAFSLIELASLSSISLILLAISSDCSLAFLVAIVSTIAATSGYSFAHSLMSSSDFMETSVLNQVDMMNNESRLAASQHGLSAPRINSKLPGPF